MQEKSLLKLSLIIAIIGLFLLFIFTKEVKLDSKISYDVDDFVEFKGNVKSINEFNNSVTLFVEKSDTIKVILFDKPYYSIKENDFLEIRGKIANNEKMELIAEDIRKIK